MFGPTVSKTYRLKWETSARAPRLLNLGGGGNIIEGALTVDIDRRADSYVNVMGTLRSKAGRWISSCSRS